jgi:hypothetical protein
LSLARTRVTVAVSGAVVAAVAALGLWQFGGPAEGRREQRDGLRLQHLHAIAEAILCHAHEGADPARPTGLAALTEACLAPGQAAALVDPAGGAGYPIDYPEPDVARVCADFERPAGVARSASRRFDPESGCLTVGLANP